MRHTYQGTFKDQNGAVVGSSTTSDGNPGTVTVYLAGTDTLASVYAAAVGGVAINSVSTDAYGYFYFWVDDTDYAYTQLFKIVLTHADFIARSYDNIQVVFLSASQAAQITASTEYVVSGFLQSGTGAIARSPQDKMRDIVHVRDFGTTVTAIQAAVDSLPARGGVVEFGNATYSFTESLILPEYVSVRGQGMDATRVNAAEGISPFVWANVAGYATTDAVGCGISDMSISCDDGSGTPVAITATDIFKFYAHRIKIIDTPSIGIKLEGASFESDIQNCRIMGCTTGIYLLDKAGVGPNSTVIYNCDIVPDNTGTGISITGGYGVKVSECHLEFAAAQGGTAIDINGPVRGTVICGNHIAANIGGCQINVRGGARLTQIIGNSRITVTGSGYGISMSGASCVGLGIENNGFEIDLATDIIKIDDRYIVNIDGNHFHFLDSGAEGCTNCIHITGTASQVNINNNVIYGEGVGDMPGAGIRIDASVTQFNITGNQIANMTDGIVCSTSVGAKMGNIIGNIVVGCATPLTIVNAVDVNQDNNI